MLTIRNEQMAVFRAAQRQALVRQLAARARTEYPDEAAAFSPPMLERALDAALHEALALGRVVLADQIRFALETVVGPARQHA
jgi:hypothetical protein